MRAMSRLGTFEPFQFFYPGRYWSPDGRNLVRLQNFVPVHGRPVAANAAPAIYDPRTHATGHAGCKCHGKCGSCKSGMGAVVDGRGSIYIPRRLRGLGDDAGAGGFGDGGFDFGSGGLDGGGDSGGDFSSFIFDGGGGGGGLPSGVDPYGVDAQGDPVYIDSQGNVYDQSGNVLSDLSQITNNDAGLPGGVDFYGLDANNNPVFIDSQGNVYDQNGNILTDLSQVTNLDALTGSQQQGQQQAHGSGGGGGGGGMPSGGGGGGPKGSPQQQQQQQQQKKALINSLSNTAGTLLAARRGITPGQFAAQQNTRQGFSFSSIPTLAWVALGIAAVGVAMR